MFRTLGNPLRTLIELIDLHLPVYESTTIIDRCYACNISAEMDFEFKSMVKVINQRETQHCKVQ